MVALMITEQEAWDVVQDQPTGAMYVTTRDAVVRKPGCWQYMATAHDPTLVSGSSIVRDIMECQKKGLPWSFV